MVANVNVMIDFLYIYILSLRIVEKHRFNSIDWETFK